VTPGARRPAGIIARLAPAHLIARAAKQTSDGVIKENCDASLRCRRTVSVRHERVALEREVGELCP
jgi:hypothetical protein